MPRYLGVGEMPELAEQTGEYSFSQEEPNSRSEIQSSAQSQQYLQTQQMMQQRKKLMEVEEIVEPIAEYEIQPQPTMSLSEEIEPSSTGTIGNLSRRKEENDYSWMIVVVAVFVVFIALYMKK